jgi:hypothetical protein
VACVHSGDQKQILDLNLLAVFSLQQSVSQFGWCSCCSSDCPGTDIFWYSDRLFGYFSSSAHLWSVLKDFVGITVKRHSDTLWSSRAAAVNTISHQLEK